MFAVAGLGPIVINFVIYEAVPGFGVARPCLAEWFDGHFAGLENEPFFV